MRATHTHTHTHTQYNAAAATLTYTQDLTAIIVHRSAAAALNRMTPRYADQEQFTYATAINNSHSIITLSLRCSDTVSWAIGKASGL